MKQKGQKRKRGAAVAAAIVTVLVIAVTAVMNTLVIQNSSTVDNALMGTSTGASGTAEDPADTYDAAAIQELGTRIGEEGYVLLQNNGALPLEDSGVTINILGTQYINFVYGGGGSGRLDSSNAVRLAQALESAGFTVNSKLDSFNRDYAEAHNMVEKESFSAINIGLGQVSTFIEEIPASEYEGVDFGDYGVAMIVFSRRGAEEADLSESVLTLNDNEKKLLAYARGKYEKVIVVLNTSNVMALGDDTVNVENCADAVIWVGNPGNTDLIALGRILNGTVNPSGRTVDTWAYRLSSAPALLNNGVYYNYSNTTVAIDDLFRIYTQIAQFPDAALRNIIFRQDCQEFRIHPVVCKGNGNICLPATKRCLQYRTLEESFMAGCFQAEHDFSKC